MLTSPILAVAIAFLAGALSGAAATVLLTLLHGGRNDG